jgi:multiple sugar transport system substrate-binding protein
MKRLLAILLVLSALTSSAVFAQASGGSLTVWMKKGFVDEQNVAFEKHAKEFAAKKNITLNLEFFAYEDIFPKWTAAIQSGNVPDVSFFGYQEVGQFSKQGVLAQTNSLIGKLEKQYGKIFPNTIEAVTFGGKSYAIPYWGEGTGLYYRKDILAKAGFNNPPATWDEFRTIALKTTDASKGIYGAGMGYGAGNSDAEWLSRSIIWSFGGSIFDKNGKVAFNTPETKKAVQFIADWYLKDKITPPTAMGWNDSGNNTAYLSGQAVMVVNTGSIVKAMEKNDPDLLALTGTVALPAGPAGRFTAGISNNLAIFEKSKNKALAEEFLIYMMDPQWYKTWIEVSAPLALPVYVELAKEPVWQKPQYKAFMDSMATFKFLGYKGDYAPEAGKIYNNRIINTLFENIVVKGMGVDAAVANFQTEAEKAAK